MCCPSGPSRASRHCRSRTRSARRERLTRNAGAASGATSGGSFHRFGRHFGRAPPRRPQSSRCTMAMTKASKIWMNGKWVAWDDARVHVLSHVLHYASSVFEGIRCYDTRRGPAIFRLDKHLDRLMLSTKVYRMELPFTREQIQRACIESVAINDLKECYIRPLVYRGYENLGVNPFGNPIDVAIAAFPWGKYLGEDALNKGVAVKVSSWMRMAPNTMPAMAKASSNYMNSQLMKMEALVDGYTEAIALD